MDHTTSIKVGATVCWSDRLWTVRGCWEDGVEDVLILQDEDGMTEDVLASAIRLVAID